MKDEIKSEFLLFDGEPELLTEELGLQPTKVVRAGEVMQTDSIENHSHLTHARNVWIIKSDFPTQATVDEHVNLMLKMLKPYTNKIAQITTKYEGEISVYGFANYADRLALHLDVGAMRSLSELGISLDIDVYPTE